MSEEIVTFLSLKIFILSLKPFIINKNDVERIAFYMVYNSVKVNTISLCIKILKYVHALIRYFSNL